MLRGRIFALLKTLSTLSLMTLQTTASQNCTTGYYVEGLCKPCPSGTFRPQSGKVYHCDKCRVADEVMNEEVRLPCTATSNSVIGCKEKFFRLAEDSQEAHCAPCSVCGLGSNLFRDYEVRKCSEHEDATCCPEPYDVLLAGACVDKRALPTTTGIATHEVPEDPPDTTSSVVDVGQLVRTQLRNVAGNFRARGSEYLLSLLPSKLVVLLILNLLWRHYLGKPL